MKTQTNSYIRWEYYLVILLFLAGNSSGQETINVFDNFRIFPSHVTQTEVFITINPTNENNLFASCNTLTFVPFFVSEGIYVSDDGGDNWYGSDSCNGQLIEFHGGDPGIAIDKNGRYIITRLGRTPLNGLYSHFSYDKGITWTNQVSISNDDLERASVASDTYIESMYYGNTYASWVRFSNPFPIMFSKVGSESETWTEPVSINNPSNRSAGGDITVSNTGAIFVCWAGVSEQSPFKELFVGFSNSLNGGESWNVSENAFPMNGITGILPDKGNIRVNGLPNIATDNTGGPRNGWIYIVTGQKDLPPAGNDPDIILNVSKDNGITWMSGIRVNQDALNNGKVQYFPAVHVDRFGGLNILYYDDRNTSSDSTGVFLSRSLDGGESWKEYQVSDHNFKPQAIGGLGQGYQGDNIDLTSTSEEIIPVWMDNSTGHYQIWSSKIRFSDIDRIDESLTSDDIDLKLFPIPTEDIINIEYDSRSGGELILTLFNINGSQSYTLQEKRLIPGKNKISLNTNELGLKNGIYLLQMNIGGIIATKKLLLMNQ